MADVQATVDVDVEGANALDRAAEAADQLAAAVDKARDSLAELDAEGEGADSTAAAMQAAADAADELAHAADSARDALAEISGGSAGTGAISATLEEAAGSAEALASALRSDADAMAELDAAGAASGDAAAGLDADAASAEALKEALHGARDAYAEQQAAATSASAGGIAGQLGLSADELERKLPQIAAIGEEAQTRLAGAGRDIEGGGLPPVPGAPGGPSGPSGGGGRAYEALEREMGTYRSEAEKADEAQQKLNRDIHAAAMDSGGGLGQLSKLGEAASQIERVKADIADAEPQINAMNDAILDSSHKAQIASDAMSEWHGVMSDGKTEASAEATRNADSAIRDFADSGDDALRTLEDLGGAAGGGGIGGDLEGLASAGGKAASALDGIGGAFGSISGLAMPALFGALGTAIAGVIPAAMAITGGIGSFAALAAPAFEKVKDGYTSVTQAQQAYTTAAGVEKRDPTTSNLAAQKSALAALRTAWATLPAPIATAVRSVQSMGKAWSQLGSTSGIEKDALGDIPKVADDIKGLFPAMGKLAQGAAPQVSRLLTDLGEFEKSKGFSNFTSSLKKDLGPALSSLKPFANALGGLLTDLASPAFAKTGDNFIKSIGNALKGITPATMSAVSGGLKGMTSVLNAIGKHGGDLTTAVGDFKNLEKVNLGALAGQMKTINGAFGSGGLTGNLSALDKFIDKHGSSTTKGTSPLESAAISAMSQIPGMAMYAAYLKQHEETVHPKVKVEPQVTRTDLPASKLFPKAGAGPFTLRPKVNVVPDVTPKDLSFSKLFGGHDPDLPQRVKVTPKVDPGGAHAALQSGMDAAAKNVTVHGLTVSLANAKLTGLDALQGVMKSAAAAAGRGFDTALGSAIASGAAAAAGNAKAVAAQIQSAFSGLAGEMHSVGVQADAGLAAGITAGEGAAVAAAHGLAAAVESAARVELQTKSPSKKFRKIGQDTIQGLILGMEGGKSAVKAAMRLVLGNPFEDSSITSATAKLRKDIQDMANSWDPRMLTQVSGLTQMLTTDNKKLMTLAKQRSHLVSEIKAADALAKSVQAAAIAGGDITQIAPNTQAGVQQADQAEGAPGTADNPYANIQQGLQGQLSAIKTFRSQIIKLKKDGLDKAGIQQLLAAGVQSGGATATQMLAEGKAGVEQITKLQDSIGMASKKLGVTGANASYEAGSEIGGGLAAGLKASLKSVDSAMSSIAKSLVTAIMTAMGDSSKSIKDALKKMDKELGLGSSGTGSGASGSGGKKTKVTPPHIVEKAPIMHIPHIVSSGGGARMQPQTLHADITVNVGGTALARVTQSFALQHAARAPTTYPALPGRN